MTAGTPTTCRRTPECGGDQALAEAIRRIQELGYVACLHDNYQDMYQRRKELGPGLDPEAARWIADGGRALAGRRAYLVCAPSRSSWPCDRRTCPPSRRGSDRQGYFIDTTYAVGPQECFDPKHPLGRNDDIASKIKLSEAARKTFGIFGSECGREWALPCSDFFEGLVGVAGRDYHNLKPESLGAKVIPFWEMVYHDCQVCYGKYGYAAGRPAEYVAHHLLAARPLNYHSIPDHLYWKAKDEARRTSGDQRMLHASRPGMGRRAPSRGRVPEDHPGGARPADTWPRPTTGSPGSSSSVPTHAAPGNLRRESGCHGGRRQRRTYRGSRSSPGWADRSCCPRGDLSSRASKFAAFLARRWNGRDYPEGALFTLRPVGGETLIHAGRVRVFHGFGDPRIDWRGSTHEVRREEVIAIPGPK